MTCAYIFWFGSNHWWPIVANHVKLRYADVPLAQLHYVLFPERNTGLVYVMQSSLDLVFAG